jgi:aspartyl-tRNA(Asn)/glutamyl-tRNA(Gln) amidotransferase subunit C
MPGIDLDHLLFLAALELPEAERRLAARDLEGIINMIDQMQAVDTEGVLPMANPLDARQRLREDAADPNIDRDLMQSTTTSVHNGYYVVPRVIE